MSSMEIHSLFVPKWIIVHLSHEGTRKEGKDGVLGLLGFCYTAGRRVPSAVREPCLTPFATLSRALFDHPPTQARACTGLGWGEQPSLSDLPSPGHGFLAGTPTSDGTSKQEYPNI